MVATLGSFAASLYEHRHFRREREADAALVFGELLHALSLHIQVLREAHGHGDPFGPITIRMARAVRREIEIYERNRERLFGVRDAALRLHTHALMVRLTFALERVLDTTEAMVGGLPEAERAELALGREQSFEFLMEGADELPGLARRFADLAKARLVDLDPASVGLTAPASPRQPRGSEEA